MKRSYKYGTCPNCGLIVDGIEAKPVENKFFKDDIDSCPECGYQLINRRNRYKNEILKDISEGLNAAEKI